MAGTWHAAHAFFSLELLHLEMILKMQHALDFNSMSLMGNWVCCGY